MSIIHYNYCNVHNKINSVYVDAFSKDDVYNKTGSRIKTGMKIIIIQ